MNRLSVLGVAVVFAALTACPGSGGAPESTPVGQDKPLTFNQHPPQASGGAEITLETKLPETVSGGGANGNVNTPPACTYTYSDWSACLPTNTQTRTLASVIPVGCKAEVKSPPVLQQPCAFNAQPPPVVAICVPGVWSDCKTTSNEDGQYQCKADGSGFTVCKPLGETQEPASATTLTKKKCQALKDADELIPVGCNEFFSAGTNTSGGGSMDRSPADLAVVSREENRLDVLSLKKDGTPSYIYWNGASWSCSKSLGGTIKSAPVMVSWGKDRLDVFGRGTDDALWHTFYDGKWHAWDSLGGQITNSPTAVSWGVNRLDVFARWKDGTLQHKFYDGQWHDWESLGGQITNSPTAVSWGENRLDVFARGTDGILLHTWVDGDGWHKLESLGGQFTSSPAAISLHADRLDVFGRGTDGILRHTFFNDGSWHAWESLGVPITISSNPTAVTMGKDVIEIFARGTDGALGHIAYNEKGPYSAESLDDKVSSSPAAASWGENHLDVFVRGTDGALGHKFYEVTSGGWHTFNTLAALDSSTCGVAPVPKLNSAFTVVKTDVCFFNSVTVSVDIPNPPAFPPGTDYAALDLKVTFLDHDGFVVASSQSGVDPYFQGKRTRVGDTYTITFPMTPEVACQKNGVTLGRVALSLYDWKTVFDMKYDFKSVTLNGQPWLTLPGKQGYNPEGSYGKTQYESLPKGELEVGYGNTLDLYLPYPGLFQ